ncbi:MAG TPA: dolichyl-phosphate beta-glucosyltransferase [Terriglobia bacterium]|nr:dolichyl-phosphate beta-glucosyltransferase [Terriglobia bacterium]
MDEPFLSIVIPAYNEAQRIGKSLEKVRQYLDSRPFSAEVIVVDDGSTDETPRCLQDAAAEWGALRIFRAEPNHGKGYSVRLGALEARGEYVLFTDADLSTPIEAADRLLEVMECMEADAVVGSRALNRKLIGVHQPRFRELSGIFFNLLVRIFTGLSLRDTQCGFKLFRRDTTRKAFQLQQTEGFGFDPELLFLIKRSGGRIIEVPVRWNNDPATKVRFLRDSSMMFWELVRTRWRARRR